ncbi:hypothetical protein ABZ508_14480 [Streptomyces lavendulocolor]|uniref:DUF2933 domain-containing protein n=1 Tax=Streptomyces lavendulocolor TaxID=67316 RepID=A0ABV2W789_9ACTN|nr:hypothetical protein GCM10018771_19370 [Streptomyces cellulosae]
MSSETLALVLLLLACPVGMCLMMWLMGRHQRQNQAQHQPKHPSGTPVDPDAKAAEITRLQAEVDQLKAAQRDSAQGDAQGRPPRSEA